MERLTHSGTKEAKNDVNIMQVLGKLAYYEDMEEQGRMKILPQEDKDSGTSENREWILYIDRLPPEPPKVAQTKEELEEMISNETLQEYLVTLNSGGRVTTLYYAGDSYWYDQRKELLLVVTAWQPLPEPYKLNNQAAVQEGDNQ